MEFPQYEIVTKPSATPEYIMVMVKCESLFWWREDKSTYLGSYRQWDESLSEVTIAVHIPNTKGMTCTVRQSSLDTFLDTVAKSAIVMQMAENMQEKE